jgi:SAM-dependent methyltransferase
VTRSDVVSMIAAHYAALITDALHQTGVLKALRVPSAPAELAMHCGLAEDLLAPLLAFVALTTTLVERRPDGRFALTGEDRDLAFSGHMLDQYVGGYGPPLAALGTLLREGRTAASLVDLGRHAAAFAGCDAGPLSEAAKLVLDLGATGVIELGCGGGQTLCALAAADPALTALGIDANPALVASATARAGALGLSKRVQIKLGDALEVLDSMPIDGVQVILAASMLNALWNEAGRVAAFVRKLGSLLPGRLLVVSDYYSHLAGDSEHGTARTLLHDIAQLVSGQGLPPPSIDGWKAAYTEANASFLHAFEASADGIDRFIHLVKLPD